MSASISTGRLPTSWRSWPPAAKQKLLLQLRDEASRRGVGAVSRVDDSEQWRPWLNRHFSGYVKGGFANYHEEFWSWLWGINQERPNPFVGLWPRGWGKSTSTELGVAALAHRGIRPYAVYVSGTQEQADLHISAISELLQRLGIGRGVDKYGNSKGWRRNRLRADNGFTCDALGIDTAARGIKIDENRPGLLVFDDIDGKHDSPTVTAKKEQIMTYSILPSGADNCAVLFMQNLIHNNSIAKRLEDGRATYLISRKVSGPHKAIDNLKVETIFDPAIGKQRSIIVGGTPTWDAKPIEVCQRLIDDYGLPAFMAEQQQEVEEVEGALWTRDLINALRRSSAPRMKRIAVGVDPSGGGDEIGIIVAGRGFDDHFYVLADFSKKGSLGTSSWGRAVIDAYEKWEADKVAVEMNFGGDMATSNIRTLDNTIPIHEVRASRAKLVRAEPMATKYQKGEAHHIGDFPELEAEQTSYTPDTQWSPNRLDACVWCYTELFPPIPARTPQQRPTSRFTG